jgi:hypothetical protein
MSSWLGGGNSVMSLGLGRIWLLAVLGAVGPV